MHITYDKSVDAAYICVDNKPGGEVANTVSCENLPPGINGEVNLDFDKSGKLLGIEVLGASHMLPEDLLNN
ncbi:MAG TPA: DUF2283 domain-containing protein [Candidatus Saccharimonadales bacterium]|nr:DUF2283 domain-containing protein [Candidatus Saccharimonadales bacterium]